MHTIYLLYIIDIYIIWYVLCTIYYIMIYVYIYIYVIIVIQGVYISPESV